MNRLLTTVSCTFLLVWKRFLVLFIIISMLTAGGAFLNNSLPGFGPMLGIINDTFISVFIFLFGIKLYESHTSFCIVNNVSKKYRIISGICAALAITLAAAALSCVSRIIIFGIDGYTFSLPNMLRSAVKTALISSPLFIWDMLEVTLFLMAVFMFGYFISSLKQGIGSIKLLLILLGTAALLCGNIMLSAFTGINPVSLLMTPFAAMQSSPITSALLNIILTVLLGFWGTLIKTENINSD
ncbi:MAG: hypothetical protein ACI4KR_00135 [Ruminiclostridium sp.]